MAYGFYDAVSRAARLDHKPWCQLIDGLVVNAVDCALRDLWIERGQVGVGNDLDRVNVAFV